MAHMTRRQMLLAMSASAFALGAGLPPSIRTGHAASTLNLLSWGWGYDTTIKNVIAPKFKRAEINLEVGTNAANYSKLIAQRSNPVLSGGLFNGIFSYRGHKDDLWVPIGRSDIPNAADILPSSFLETGGVIFGVQPYGIVYNPDRVEEPKSWLDLFDPKYKGKVGLSDFYFDGFGMTAKALGKSADDVAAGVAAWAEHKDNIGPWPQSPAQAHDLVERGELWLAFTFGGIAEGARASGKKIAFAVPKEGATAVVDVIQAIKGFDEATTQATKEFLALFLQDDAQIAFTKAVFTSPVSKTAKIPAELADRPGLMSAEEAARLIQPDFSVIAAKYGEYKNLVNQKLKS